MRAGINTVGQSEGESKFKVGLPKASLFVNLEVGEPETRLAFDQSAFWVLQLHEKRRALLSWCERRQVKLWRHVLCLQVQALHICQDAKCQLEINFAHYFNLVAGLEDLVPVRVKLLSLLLFKGLFSLAKCRHSIQEAQLLETLLQNCAVLLREANRAAL